METTCSAAIMETAWGGVWDECHYGFTFFDMSDFPVIEMDGFSEVTQTNGNIIQ